MLKRDMSYELFSRELQALNELFSREPEDWADWAGFAKREPSPGGGRGPQPPKPAPRPDGPVPIAPNSGGSGTPSLIHSINS